MEYLESLQSRLLLRLRAHLGRNVHVVGRIWVHGGGAIRIGDGVVLDGRRGPIELHSFPGAELVLHDGVRIEGGTSIEAVESVVVGAGTQVGAWSKVLDNHFHELDDHFARPRSEPVSIGPNAKIGERTVVLPGARLEEGVRLGHGVVVSRRVPAGVTLEGSPPRRSAGGTKI